MRVMEDAMIRRRRKMKNFVILSVICLLFFTSCGSSPPELGSKNGSIVAIEKSQATSAPNEEADSESLDNVYTVEEEYDINLNHIGFFTEEEKLAIVTNDNGGDTFRIVNDTGLTLYTGNLSNENSVNLKEENIRYAEFSDFREEGTYFVMCGEEVASSSFSIQSSLYDDTIGVLLESFYINQCGVEVHSTIYNDDTRKPCHSSLATVYGTKEKRDVTGGWHESNDVGRYVVPSAVSVGHLLMLYEGILIEEEELSLVILSEKEKNGIFEAIKYELDWLMKMQDEKSGGVYHKVTAASPTTEDEGEELYVFDISTTATADFAAIMAMSSQVFANIDGKYAAKCLEAAEDAWKYLKNHQENKKFVNPTGVTTKEYADVTDLDERYWAAAQLYKATKENTYLRFINNNYDQLEEIDFGWKNVSGFGHIALLSSLEEEDDLLIEIRKEIESTANYYVEQMESNAYFVVDEPDGDNLSIATKGLQLFFAYRMTNNDSYWRAACRYRNYLLGANRESMNAIDYVLHEDNRSVIELNATLLHLIVSCNLFHNVE